ncbi:MAG: dipeptide ABC transporter ATP-binding protein [Alphaproteobacteria bacterium]|nr:dipeptide ABC transporter ATP-binding protein [Alphaproteobacteria bacterium]
MSEPLLSVRNLVKQYPVQSESAFAHKRRFVSAVDGVSFELNAGETLGVVGESGCGKSTLGRAVLMLEKPTSGSVLFGGREINRMGTSELRTLRSAMQIIFQDPYSSLNPRMRINEILSEPFEIHGPPVASTVKDRIADLLASVGLTPLYAERFPHELSGGQRQRVGIARALALNPRLIVCDEPVSALDVSVQAQVLNLLKDLQRQHSLAYLFIAHGLAAVRHVSDRVAVMYLGRIVELSDVASLFAHPAHPYTQALLAANPKPDPRKRSEIIPVEGEMPSPVDPPSGCRFHTRCRFAASLGNRCSTESPLLKEVAAGQFAACHLHDQGHVA